MYTENTSLILNDWKNKNNQIWKIESLFSSQEKDKIEHQNRWMKLANSVDNKKLVYEGGRKTQMKQTKLYKKPSDAFIDC